MNNIVNICFSEFGGAIFKIAISMDKLPEKQKIIVLTDDLSHGPIKGGVNIEERINWWSTVDEGEYFVNYGEEDLRENYNKFHNKISKIDDNDTLYLWYGSSQEFCGMLYTLELLKDRNLNVYLINVTDIVVEYKNKVYLSRGTGEITSECIEKYVSFKQKLDSDKYKQLLDTWEALKKENSILRLFKNEEIKSEDENYFDIDILKYTSKEFRKPTRILRLITGKSEIEVSGDYIFWRVNELVKCGKIDYSGKLGIITKMQIKITEEGLKQLSTDKKAMSIWENNKNSLDEKEYIINEYIEEGRLEEKVNIAKRLKDVLDAKTIADKTGLTVGQVKNL
jgi:ribosomal protein L3